MKKIIKIVLLVAVLGASIAGISLYIKIKNRPIPAPIVPREEIDITIIPGWNLKQIVADWISNGIIKDENELYQRLGIPTYNYSAFNKKAPVLNFQENRKDLFPLLLTRPDYVSYEGYLFPDTYRIYKDAELHEVLKKIFSNLEKKITAEMRLEINKQGKNLFQILTMASLIEREARSQEEMEIISDIFWRRLNRNWALQSCASVNYITGKNVPYVSAQDTEIDSPYNTYKYPGLPLGPIGNPGLSAIKAAIYPSKNNYWYFMTGNDGIMRYASKLDQHNSNVYKYLK
ncbi:MAG: endolytic transglycosylase MltG [bacterium]